MDEKADFVVKLINCVSKWSGRAKWIEDVVSKRIRWKIVTNAIELKKSTLLMNRPLVVIDVIVIDWRRRRKKKISFDDEKKKKRKCVCFVGLWQESCELEKGKDEEKRRWQPISKWQYSSGKGSRKKSAHWHTLPGLLRSNRTETRKQLQWCSK